MLYLLKIAISCDAIFLVLQDWSTNLKQPFCYSLQHASALCCYFFVITAFLLYKMDLRRSAIYDLLPPTKPQTNLSLSLLIGHANKTRNGQLLNLN